MSSTPLLCSMVCFVSVAAAVCRAEQITLSNGDRLTGTVQRLSGGKVVIETDYAGEVSIDLKSIASIVTEGEMTVVLDNDTRTFGQLSGDGQRLQVAGGPALAQYGELLGSETSDGEAGERRKPS